MLHILYVLRREIHCYLIRWVFFKFKSHTFRSSLHLFEFGFHISDKLLAFFQHVEKETCPISALLFFKHPLKNFKHSSSTIIATDKVIIESSAWKESLLQKNMYNNTKQLFVMYAVAAVIIVKGIYVEASLIIQRTFRTWARTPSSHVYAASVAI